MRSIGVKMPSAETTRPNSVPVLRQNDAAVRNVSVEPAGHAREQLLVRAVIDRREGAVGVRVAVDLDDAPAFALASSSSGGRKSVDHCTRSGFRIGQSAVRHGHDLPHQQPVDALAGPASAEQDGDGFAAVAREQVRVQLRALRGGHRQRDGHGRGLSDEFALKRVARQDEVRLEVVDARHARAARPGDGATIAGRSCRRAPVQSSDAGIGDAVGPG